MEPFSNSQRALRARTDVPRAEPPSHMPWLYKPLVSSWSLWKLSVVIQKIDSCYSVYTRGTCKLRNETRNEIYRNETKRNSPKRNENYRNETKSMRNEINRNEIDRNETKRYNTKWNKTYFNETISWGKTRQKLNENNRESII